VVYIYSNVYCPFCQASYKYGLVLCQGTKGASCNCIFSIGAARNLELVGQQGRDLHMTRFVSLVLVYTASVHFCWLLCFAFLPGGRGLGSYFWLINNGKLQKLVTLNNTLAVLLQMLRYGEFCRTTGKHKVDLKVTKSNQNYARPPFRNVT
jgi:hypothetical protein